MSIHVRRLILSLCLLLAAATAWGAPDKANSSLNGAAALVVSANATNGTVVLRVLDAGRRAVPFQVSPSCLYDPSIANLSGVRPNMHVLVWTQPAQAGTLPVIYRLALQLR